MTRLNVYKNAYQKRLYEVIDKDHNILGIYLGDDLFELMVKNYIQLYPSNNTSLRQYADRLPDFLSKYEPFSLHPIISEIARFERSLFNAFDASDAARTSIDDLNQVPTHLWPQLKFNFHPSVQRLFFQWNAVDCWQAIKQEKSPDNAHNKRNCWIIWRNADRLTEFRSLNNEEATLIDMILTGKDFSQLCEFISANNSSSESDAVALASNYLTQWVRQGLLRKI